MTAIIIDRSLPAFCLLCAGARRMRAVAAVPPAWGPTEWQVYDLPPTVPCPHCTDRRHLPVVLIGGVR